MDGTTLTVQKNDLIYLPKGSTYNVVTIQEGGTYCINFQEFSENSFPPLTVNVKNADEFLLAYKNAEKAWRRKKQGYDYLCKAELYKILYLLQSNNALPYLPNSKQALLSPAISYIHKHYANEGISVEDLSRLCGVSYEYFRRLFHQIYDCSPIHYINRLKLNRAKELLSSGFYSVSEAALLSGFADISYFSRFFKKHVGISPLAYLNGQEDD